MSVFLNGWPLNQRVPIESSLRLSDFEKLPILITPTKSDLFIKELFELGHILINFGLELADIGKDFG